MMPASNGRLAPEPIQTPYQLTLAALRVPLGRLLLLNAAMGFSFGLIAGPLPALLWAAGLSASDFVLQRIYRRFQARAPSVESHVGLRRLAWAGFAKAVAWTSGPTLFAVIEGSQLAMMFVALISIALIALAGSSVRNSATMFLTMALTLIAGLAVSAVAVVGVGPGAGLFLGMGIVVVLLFQVAGGTSRTVAEWNSSNQRTAEAMTRMAAALQRSEAAERRSGIAIDLADLYVFEADYVSRTFSSAGANAELYDKIYGGDVFWDDSFRSVHPDDLPGVKAAWAKHRAGEGPYRVEHRAQGIDGRELWISASAELIRDETGRPRAMVGALRNITERKLSQISLSRALEEAEAASRVKSEFLTLMSHEVRTPLNGVLGMAQVMERDDLSEPQRTRLATLRASGEDLLVLLNSILDLAALEGGALVLDRGEVDIQSVAASALKSVEPAAAHKGLALTFDVSPEAEGSYAGDPVRVGEIFSHLLSNAVKFTQAGSISLRVNRRDGALVIQVTDTGIGISSEQQDHLFETFVQVDLSLRRKYAGGGLGLALCQQLSARMGGSLALDSRLGFGSTFTVTLPLQRLQNVDREEAGTALGVTSQPYPLRVLVAEDNPVNQLVLRTLLQQFGIEPVIVGDGAQAFASWRDGDWDIILMDIQMPEMDGIAASHAIRSAEAVSGRARTPIVAVTANILARQMKAYGAAGIDDVVAKPVQIVCLIEAMERALAVSKPDEQPDATVAA